MTHRFTNCTFDLRGADYACVSRGDEFEIGYIGEGDRVLIDGDTLDFTGLHILGPVALADRIKAAIALECYAMTTERQAAMEKAFCMGRDAAAAWHTMQAETAMGALCCGSDNYEIRRAGRVSDMHRGHSEAIRALTPPADLAAKIGGE